MGKSGGTAVFAETLCVMHGGYRAKEVNIHFGEGI
jgi:hypothetical protein